MPFFGVAHGELDRRRRRRALANSTRARQQDRPPEADLDREGVGQAALERRQAAGLGPHAVGDRRREAERLRGQRVHVDRVAVARDGGVAAAEVAAELPLGAGGRSAGSVGVVARASPAARRLAAAAAQHRAGALPDQLVAGVRLGEEAEGAALRVRLERVGADAQRQLLADARSAGAGRSGSRRGRARRRRTGSCRRPSPPCAAGRRARAGRWAAGGRAARSRRPWRRRRRRRARPGRPARVELELGDLPAADRAGRAAARRRGSSAPPRARRAAGCWAGCRACGSSIRLPAGSGRRRGRCCR